MSCMTLKIGTRSIPLSSEQVNQDYLKQLDEELGAQRRRKIRMDVEDFDRWQPEERASVWRLWSTDRQPRP